ncbi:hypothetical protein AKJ08_1820 [Vulgatibacter incomptus]|uniref:Uncharacterized protein n=1 Tax=Vulgatibacter incomptus TaxID=1391653 RepID=A0A0K1PD14_9BACT|nr:hypothetical protein AKJ08_1820 [Vulgatibacter incomptus]
MVECASAGPPPSGAGAGTEPRAADCAVGSRVCHNLLFRPVRILRYNSSHDSFHECVASEKLQISLRGERAKVMLSPPSSATKPHAECSRSAWDIQRGAQSAFSKE